MSQRLTGANKKDTPKSRVNGDQSTDASAKQNMAGNEDRHRMISTAAYYRAEQQGFDGVHEMQDWLEAEAEIDIKFYR
jgi:hypothetical protein